MKKLVVLFCLALFSACGGEAAIESTDSDAIRGQCQPWDCLGLPPPSQVCPDGSEPQVVCAPTKRGCAWQSSGCRFGF